MKFLAIYLFIFFGLLSDLAGQQKEDIQISGSFRNLSFVELVTKLEKQYPLHFYFDEKWIRSLQVSIDAQQLSVPEFMEKLLLPTLLDYTYQPLGKIFILPDKKFSKTLPEYYFPKSGQDSIQDKQRDLTGMEEKYLRGRKPDMIKTMKNQENRLLVQRCLSLCFRKDQLPTPPDF